MEHNALWYGAIDDGETDCTCAIQSAIDVMENGDVLYLPTRQGGHYKITDALPLPPKNLKFKGDGPRSSTIVQHAPTHAFRYFRPAGVYSTIHTFEGLTFIKKDLTKDVGTYAIWEQGYDDNHADNYLRVRDCQFYGWEAGIKSKWTGQSRVHDCFFQANKYSTFLERGASFWSYRDNMSFDDTFIFGNDPLADGYSNAIFVDSCSNVCGNGTAIDITGWQSIYIDKCGLDFGGGGIGTLSFNKCMDVAIAKSYISSNGIADRVGLKIIDTPRVSITHNRIVNCSRGITTWYSYPWASAVVIDGNGFSGNAHNDILFGQNTTASKIVTNHFSKQQARINDEFEVFVNTPGTVKNTIAFNTFYGTPYAMNADVNSIIGSNTFNAPPG